MTEILIKYISPFFFILGIFSLGLKGFLHFKYLKIIENYPKDLKFIQIGSHNFFGLFRIILPFFWRFQESRFPVGQTNNCRQLERLINICLRLFYWGMISLISGVVLSNSR